MIYLPFILVIKGFKKLDLVISTALILLTYNFLINRCRLNTKLLIICSFVFNFLIAQAQVSKKGDSSTVRLDSNTLVSANNDIASKIEYKAKDSIIYNIRTKKMHLFNESKIAYTDMLVEAYFIDYDWTSGMLAGNQLKQKDSVKGRPYMQQAGKDYYTDKLLYNFKSKKGKVYDIITKEEEALLHGHEVKKDSIGNWYIYKAKYTTCDLEHPHFYFNAKKLKLTTKKSIVTGPTNIVINDVKTPIYLPFGIFPAQKGRRSGIIFPQQYGFSPFFNLQNMGVYFGLNDYMDAKLLADVYFNGSYKFIGNLRYNKLYKYDGEFTAETNRIFTGDSDNPIVSGTTPINYIFNWRHTQSLKAHPTFTFNSDLRYMTQGAINRSLTLDQSRITGQINSNLNVTKRFRRAPITINGGISYNQDLKTETVSGSLPSLRINYNGNIYNNPNKANSLVINLQHTTNALAQLPSTPDSNIFNGRFLKNLSLGLQHNAVFSFQNIRLFKYFNITPRLSYNDYMYFKKINISRDSGEKKPDSIITNGVFTARDFNGGINLNTVIIGMFPISKKGLIRGIRHQITPVVDFSYAPDFSTDFWGYFNRYNDTLNKEVRYFQYLGSNSSIGGSSTAILSFGINNALEGKFRNKKDSTLGTKKLMLLDALSINSSYNFNADSFKMDYYRISFSNSTLQFLTFSGSMVFDPYHYENGTRKDKFNILEGTGIARFMNMNATVNLNLNASNVSRRILNSQKGSEYERNFVFRNYHYFYDFNSPWNLSTSFNVDMRSGFTSNKLNDTSIVNASIVLNNFDFNLTKNWKIAISSGFDFNTKQIGLTTISAIRDMHCWEFRVNYIPISNIGQAYTIEIRPKAALLQDLRLSRNRPLIENYF